MHDEAHDDSPLVPGRSSSPCRPRAAGGEEEARLSVVGTATLLVADCVGTGILALPGYVATLGRGPGLAFIAANLAVNVFAGGILDHAVGIGEHDAALPPGGLRDYLALSK